MTTLIIDDKAVAELETKYDSEMRFRPMANIGLTTVTFLLIALSAFHYYTAGFAYCAKRRIAACIWRS